MSERLNKTSICSIAFIDIIEYSKKSVSELIECKERFNRLLSDALKDVAQNDRIIIDTGDGAAIAFLGSPEDALFVSLTIRDSILASEEDESVSPLRVRIGINLGPVRVVKDINNQLNIIGDGINVAQRVMGFAEQNQILVSRSYYEIVSRLSDEITQMFAYFGIRQDKHVREHEVYMIRSPIDVSMEAETEPGTEPARGNAKIRLAMVVGGLAVVVGGLLFVAAKPRLAEKSPEQVAMATAPVASASATPAPASTDAEPAKEEPEPKAASKPKKVRRHADSPKTAQNTTVATNKPIEVATPERGKHAQQPSSASPCSDAQRMLRQCN